MFEPIDFCSNSLTLNIEQKKYANHKYNKLVSQVYQIASTSLVPMNIYIGGSLALREPSLLFNKGKLIGLHSDIDFFIVVKKPNDIHSVVEIFRSLENIEADIPRSTHIAPLVKIPANLCFPSVDDLLSGLATPVVEKFPINEFVPGIIRNPRTMADLLICRAAISIMPYYLTSHQYSNTEHNKSICSTLDTLKMIFSGLRLQYYGVVADLHSINDIVKISNNDFRDLLGDINILDLIAAREQYDPGNALPQIDLYSFIRKVWIKKLNLDLNVKDSQILAAIHEVFFKFANLIDFTLMVTAGLTFCTYNQQVDTISWLSSFILLKRDQVISAEYQMLFDNLLNYLSSSEITRGGLIDILIQVHALTLKAHTLALIAG